MKKSIAALALSLTLLGTLAACGTDKTPANNSTSGSASAGQVSRYNTYDNQGRDYFYDGRYAAGSNGQVYGRDDNMLSRDLTRGARDIVRDTGDAIGDIGRGIGNAARDITGMGSGAYSGTPSWEPDSSAVRY
ncbi:hypothetical protein N510_001646 [Firmicutes bacterium ASF500]|nr:hypothetical protein N510_001646 [Firmicutes bacterium ASF500]